MAAVLRLGIGERGVTEIMAVSEHVSSLCVGAAALQVAPDVPERRDRRLAPLAEPSPGAGAGCLAEIAEWSRDQLGLDRAPDFWRFLGHQPRFLEATWAKDRLVFGAGRLDVPVKLCIGFAVASFRQSQYWVPYFTQLLSRRAEIDERSLVELTAAVMHYVSFNTVAHGMILGAKHTGMTAAAFAEGQGARGPEAVR